MTNLRFDEVLPCFRYLCIVPGFNIEGLAPEDRECIICKEPYDTKLEQNGTNLKKAVQLACGHALGLQCLARWMFSPGFNNMCPFCTQPIVLNVHRQQSYQPQDIRTVNYLEFIFSIRIQLGTSKADLLRLIDNMRFAAGDARMCQEWSKRGRMLFQEYVEALCDEVTASEDAAVPVPAEVEREIPPTEAQNWAMERLVSKIAMGVAVVTQLLRMIFLDIQLSGNWGTGSFEALPKIGAGLYLLMAILAVRRGSSLGWYTLVVSFGIIVKFICANDHANGCVLSSKFDDTIYGWWKHFGE